MSKETELRLHRCCFTDHRPEKLHKPEEQVKHDLEVAIQQAIADGFVTFISGMARGVDIWAEQIVLRERAKNPAIHLVAAVPYKGFESRWQARWQQEYNFILQYANLVKYICPGYSRDCFQRRNGWSGDRSARVRAGYNGEPGGTRNTIEYAQYKEVECLCI